MNDIVKSEEEILAFWKKDKTFEKSLQGKKKQYVFYDGPPFATGLPHYGHLLASTIKDSIPRFWTMKGYRVERVWGWDCHGLPIESIVERELGIKNKKQIEEMGVDAFCKACKNTVLKYVGEWKGTIERLGRWVEFDKSYKTMDADYMESVWWAFKEMWKKKLVYEGRKILLYCPHCETPLANAEIAMDNSYKEVTERSVIVKFKIKNKQEYFLAWTTTPWTLIGNVALAINTNAQYVKVKNNGETYILASERLSELEGNHEIVSTFVGKDLEGVEYEPLYDVPHDKKGHYIISDTEGVTTVEGTGIVHMAVYGEFDYSMIKKFDLPFIEHIGKDGKLALGPEKWHGTWFKSLDKEVFNDLQERNLVYRATNHKHSYPFCYRCATPLFYAPLRSWFIDIQKAKKDILKNNQKMNWYPSHLKDGRFKNNIENAPDWSISRNRYWASVIPVWKCDCGEMKVIGSVAELKEHAINFPKELDLHKHIMDAVFLKCVCGKKMKRVPEVLDCWLESGSMPFAQVHYPFEKKAWFDAHFPGDFVSEYIAQTRTWFYYSLAVSSMLFNRPPFLNVLTTGTILAEDGEKMSKSKGNFPDPLVVINKYGSDALRFYLLNTPVMTGEDIRFSEKGVEEIYKKVLLLLYNANKFYSINAQGKKLTKKTSRNVLDRWIISRLNELNEEVHDNLEKYDTVGATRPVMKFVEDFSTWYIRRSRERFNDADADVALSILGYTLLELSKIIAPLLPFVSEMIYQNVTQSKKSVHLEDWPKLDKKKIDKKLNKKMAETREVASLALKERDREAIPVRQALSSLATSSGIVVKEKELKKIIMDEINVKNVALIKGDTTGQIVVKLDTVLTDELIAEGFAREITRRVQAERKNRGLEKKDSIVLLLALDEKMSKDLKPHMKEIQEKTGAKEIKSVDKSKTKVIFKVKDIDVGIDF